MLVQAGDKEQLLWCDSLVTLEVEWCDTTFKRQQEALCKFFRQMDPTLQQCILGKGFVSTSLPRDSSQQEQPLSGKGEKISSLNSGVDPAQRQAIDHALTHPLTLIQGPPGTGKTKTCVALVHELHRRKKPGERILVTAPSNVAIDHVALKLHQEGKLKIVRMYSLSREFLASPEVLPISLHELKSQETQKEKKLADLVRRKAKGERLESMEFEYYRKQLEALEYGILSKADVICCTCIGAGDNRLKELKFENVVVDECTQGSEPEALIALSNGARRVTLIGDHLQLPPVILGDMSRCGGLARSLFERLVDCGVAHLLTRQYRMHPSISAFPSRHFYQNRIHDEVTAAQRRPASHFPWPDDEHPTMFIHCEEGRDRRSDGCVSYYNEEEADVVIEVLLQLLRHERKIVTCQDVAIITPYRAQRSHLSKKLYLLKEGGYDFLKPDQVEVASVDSFQGREKKYVIKSCVRSCEHRDLGIGFVADQRRINVGLTRAMHGLIVVGNARQLARKSADWRKLLVDYQNGSRLVKVVDSKRLSFLPVEFAVPNTEGLVEEVC
jgi:regulator of nonsense transcripts 1